ncbi:MAG: SH3 domain-containing protein [Dehalococcoidia bacterium]
MACIAILSVLLLFDLTSSGALARIAGPDAANYGWAVHEFALREGPRMTSPRVLSIRPGTRLKLIDSAGGEVLDPAASAPSKWYLVKPADGGEAGWVYAGWIRR